MLLQPVLLGNILCQNESAQICFLISQLGMISSSFCFFGNIYCLPVYICTIQVVAEHSFPLKYWAIIYILGQWFTSRDLLCCCLMVLFNLLKYPYFLQPSTQRYGSSLLPWKTTSQKLKTGTQELECIFHFIC